MPRNGPGPATALFDKQASQHKPRPAVRACPTRRRHPTQTLRQRPRPSTRPQSRAHRRRQPRRIPTTNQDPLPRLRPRTGRQLPSPRRQGLRPATVRCILCPVRDLLATAYEDGLIRTNPAARLRLVQPNQRRDAAPKRKALTEPELQRFLTALPHEWRLFFELLAHTGHCIGEAIALTWNDIDLDE